MSRLKQTGIFAARLTPFKKQGFPQSGLTGIKLKGIITQ